MTEEQKCTAVAPRALPCIDELLIANLRDVTREVASDPELARKLEEELRENEADVERAKAMHRTNCYGDLHYTDSVIGCWSVEGCQPFAACVARTSAKPARR